MPVRHTNTDAGCSRCSDVHLRLCGFTAADLEAAFDSFTALRFCEHYVNISSLGKKQQKNRIHEERHQNLTCESVKMIFFFFYVCGQGLILLRIFVAPPPFLQSSLSAVYLKKKGWDYFYADRKCLQGI